MRHWLWRIVTAALLMLIVSVPAVFALGNLNVGDTIQLGGYTWTLRSKTTIQTPSGKNAYQLSFTAAGGGSFTAITLSSYQN